MKHTFDTTIFTNSELVAKVTKNKLEEIRISILKNNKIDMRIYFYFPGETDAKPTKKGIWLSFEHIPDIIKTLEKLVKNHDEKIELEYEQSERNRTRVYVGEYLNKKIVHIRTFYLDGSKFKPGKGITFPVGETSDIVAGLKKALEKK